nr:Chain C, Matrix protein 1 peptide SALEWIKNK [Influenza B virus]7S8R_F Chain F, Matrix protein 1 peptide SALEWIKNK [Influenza B virus]
SALEWIKNK